MRLFHLIRDLTADALGGWEMVTKSLAGGGMYAQRSVARTHYDIEAAKALAREAAGIAGGAAPANGDGAQPRHEPKFERELKRNRTAAAPARVARDD
jgi:hypothetical protein